MRRRGAGVVVLVLVLARGVLVIVGGSARVELVRGLLGGLLDTEVMVDGIIDVASIGSASCSFCSPLLPMQEPSPPISANSVSAMSRKRNRLRHRGLLIFG
jgi:hypothetical protein